MPRRDARTAATAVELAVSLDDLTLELDVRPAAARPNSAVLAVYDAAQFGGVQDVARQRRVRRHRLDSVDGVGEREGFGFEMCEQFHAEFDALCRVHRSHVDRVLCRLGRRTNALFSTLAFAAVALRGERRQVGVGLGIVVGHGYASICAVRDQKRSVLASRGRFEPSH